MDNTRFKPQRPCPSGQIHMRQRWYACLAMIPLAMAACAAAPAKPAASPGAKPDMEKSQSDSGQSPEVTVKESADQSDVAGNGKDVAEITHRDRFSKIHTQFKAIGAVQRGDLADALWTESGTGSIGGPAIERRPENRNVVFPALADILDIRRFGEGIDAGEMR